MSQSTYHQHVPFNPIWNIVTYSGMAALFQEVKDGPSFVTHRRVADRNLQQMVVFDAENRTLQITQIPQTALVNTPQSRSPSRTNHMNSRVDHVTETRITTLLFEEARTHTRIMDAYWQFGAGVVWKETYSDEPRNKRHLSDVNAPLSCNQLVQEIESAARGIDNALAKQRRYSRELDLLRDALISWRNEDRLLTNDERQRYFDHGATLSEILLELPFWRNDAPVILERLKTLFEVLDPLTKSGTPALSLLFEQYHRVVNDNETSTPSTGI